MKLATNPHRSVFARLLASAALAFLALVPLRAGEPATLRFSLDFPGSNPEHYLITVQPDGTAHYESSGKISADSDATDDYQFDFTFSEAARSRIFGLVAQARYFSGKIDAANKKLAFTGTKKLSYKDGQHDASVEYVYSSNPSIEQLTSLFQGVSGTMEFCRRLAYDHRYQKLALDDELKRMEDQGRRGELSELQAAKPCLQQIYDDQSVMNVVRVRAHRIMDIPAPVLR